MFFSLLTNLLDVKVFGGEGSNEMVSTGGDIW